MIRWPHVAVLFLIGCSGSSTSTGAGDAAPADSGTEFNVEFAATTCGGPGACGGDPTGKWSIVSGCTQPATSWCGGTVDGKTGTISGTYTISAAGYSYEYKRSLTACGRNLGTSTSDTYMGSISGNRIGAVEFCVQGDSLWLMFPATYPEMTTLKLTRAM